MKNLRWMLVLACGIAAVPPASAIAQNRGLVTSQACPYSCRTQGIPKKHCRDWREGNTCYIEDLSKPPAVPPPVNNPGYNPGSGPRPPSYGNSSGLSQCRELDRREIGRPHADLGRVRPTGNLFDSKVKVSGSVEGVCVVEAGLFEFGRKVKDIPVVTSPKFQRFEFELTTKSDKNPEIRVYNVTGDRDEVEIVADNTDRDRYDPYSDPYRRR